MAKTKRDFLARAGKTSKKALVTVPTRVVVSKDFLSSFGYAFGGFLAAWVLVYLNTPDAAQAIGQYGWVIPVLQVLAKFFKEYFSQLRE